MYQLQDRQLSNRCIRLALTRTLYVLFRTTFLVAGEANYPGPRGLGHVMVTTRARMDR